MVAAPGAFYFCFLFIRRVLGRIHFLPSLEIRAFRRDELFVRGSELDRKIERGFSVP